MTPQHKEDPWEILENGHCLWQTCHSSRPLEKIQVNRYAKTTGETISSANIMLEKKNNNNKIKFFQLSHCFYYN